MTLDEGYNIMYRYIDRGRKKPARNRIINERTVVEPDQKKVT